MPFERGQSRNLGISLASRVEMRKGSGKGERTRGAFVQNVHSIREKGDVQAGAIDEKWLQRNRDSPQVFVWAPSGNSFSSSAPEGQVAGC